MTRAGHDNLDLPKYTRLWATHNLTESQQVECMRLSRGLLESNRLHEDAEFKGLASGEK
jgi:hypothetical protein